MVWLITSVVHLRGEFGFTLLMSNLFLFLERFFTFLASLDANTYRNETSELLSVLEMKNRVHIHKLQGQ